MLISPPPRDAGVVDGCCGLLSGALPLLLPVVVEVDRGCCSCCWPSAVREARGRIVLPLPPSCWCCCARLLAELLLRDSARSLCCLLLVRRPPLPKENCRSPPPLQQGFVAGPIPLLLLLARGRCFWAPPEEVLNDTMWAVWAVWAG